MRNLTKLCVGVLLAVAVLLCSCDRSSLEDDLFGATEAKKTQATVATTKAPKDEVEAVPALVPEILKENTNLVIGRLEAPVIRPITDNVSISLHYQGWPTVCAGDGETLYAASSIRLGHIDPFGCIGFYKSEDGGKTWTGPEIIADTATDDRDAGIVYLGNGKVLVSWFTHGIRNYLKGGPYYENWATRKDVTAEQHAALEKKIQKASVQETQSASYVMLSEDGGATWQAPVQVPISAPHGPTLMRDGKTLFCVCK